LHLFHARRSRKGVWDHEYREGYGRMRKDLV
jgi:hypothetical protein